jgi:hypothetical protein
MNKKIKELNDFLEEFSTYTYEEIENQYEIFLEEAYEPVRLAGMTIYASEMKVIDPVMFRCGCADFSDQYWEEVEGKYYKKTDFEEAEMNYENYLEELEEENEGEENE